MKSTHSFSIDFIIRKCKEEKKRALIYARISVDEQRREISIKEHINVVDWDSKQEIVKGKSIEAKAINQTIDNIRFKIKENYRKLEDAGELITAESVKQAYLGIHLQLKGHKLIELCDYFKTIWESKMASGNFKNYKTTIDYVELFLEQKLQTKDLYLSQLSMQFATDFEHFIRNNPIKEHDPCKGNGVAKHIQRFKRILNWAANEIQWIKSNPCEKYSCPVKKSKRKKLTMEQLVIMELKAFKDPTLEYVSDIFLFSCYTGFAFADVMQLNAGHLEWDTDGTVWCRLYRQKSEILSPVPLLKNASNIINKYKDHPNSIKRGAMFPLVSNQHVNDCLKIIGKICEFDIDLTFHVARHTFAKTVAIKNRIPIETVQVMMGHTKITTTMIYAEVDEEKIKDDFNGLDEKLDAKRKIVAIRTGNNPLQKVG